MSELGFVTRDAALRQRAKVLLRTAVSFMAAEARGTFLEDEAKTLFPHDRDVQTLAKAIVTKGAVVPSGTGSNTLAVSAVSDVINVLSGVAASAKLLAGGLQVKLDGYFGLAIPLLTASPNDVGPVAEATVIPVGQLSLDESNMLEPRKMAVIVAATRELFLRSTPTIENVLRAVYFQALQEQLDALVLGTAAGDTTKSAGLRYNIAALTASVAADPLTAMIADASLVAGSVATIAANSEIILIASPVQAIKLRGHRDRIPFTVYGSSALPDDQLMAVASNAIASSVDEVPRFEVSREATLVMRTDPAPISSVATPSTVAAPIRSLFQTDSIGVRIIMEASWIRRSDSGVAWIDNTTW